MTDAQHAETMALLSALVKQGEALADELAGLSDDVADLTGLCGTLEVLIHGLNMRFDEL